MQQHTSAAPQPSHRKRNNIFSNQGRPVGMERSGPQWPNQWNRVINFGWGGERREEVRLVPSIFRMKSARKVETASLDNPVKELACWKRESKDEVEVDEGGRNRSKRSGFERSLNYILLSERTNMKRLHTIWFQLNDEGVKISVTQMCHFGMYTIVK